MGAACSCGKSAARRREAKNGSDDEVIEHEVERIETKSGSSVLTRVNQYKMEAMLGKGAFGAVYRASDTAQGDVVAVKVMEKGELRKKTKQLGRPKPQGTMVSMTILKEIAVMKRVRHPNCVHLFEVIDDPMGDRIFLIMEMLSGGEVMAEDNLPAEKTFLEEWIARSVFRDLIDGLEYLHGNGILHRDIKPENIVFAERPAWSRKRAESNAGGLQALTNVGQEVSKAFGKAADTVLPNAVTEAVGGALTNVTEGSKSLVSGAADASKSLVSGAAELTTSAAGGLVHSLSAAANASLSSLPITKQKTNDGLARLSEAGSSRQNQGNSTAEPPQAGATAAAPTAPTPPPSPPPEPSTAPETEAAVASSAPSPAPAPAPADATQSSRERGESAAITPRSIANSILSKLPTTPRGLSDANAEQMATRGVPPAKLLDFGVSQLCVDAVAGDESGKAKKPSKPKFDDSILKATGTPPYFAPEMLAGKPFHGRPADVWASGVTLAYLVSGEMPFWSDNVPEIWRQIKEEQPKLAADLSPGLRSLLGKMLHKDPNKRPTIAALRQDEWVTDGGKDPMPKQDHLPLEITDDDIKQAIRKVAVGFTVIKCAQKWKALPAKRRAARAAVAAAAGGGEIGVVIKLDAKASKAEKSASTSGGKKSSFNKVRLSLAWGGGGAASKSPAKSPDPRSLPPPSPPPKELLALAAMSGSSGSLKRTMSGGDDKV